MAPGIPGPRWLLSFCWPAAQHLTQERLRGVPGAKRKQRASLPASDVPRRSPTLALVWTGTPGPGKAERIPGAKGKQRASLPASNVPWAGVPPRPCVDRSLRAWPSHAEPWAPGTARGPPRPRAAGTGSPAGHSALELISQPPLTGTLLKEWDLQGISEIPSLSCRHDWPDPSEPAQSSWTSRHGSSGLPPP